MKYYSHLRFFVYIYIYIYIYIYTQDLTFGLLGVLNFSQRAVIKTLAMVGFLASLLYRTVS